MSIVSKTNLKYVSHLVPLVCTSYVNSKDSDSCQVKPKPVFKHHEHCFRKNLSSQKYSILKCDILFHFFVHLMKTLKSESDSGQINLKPA